MMQELAKSKKLYGLKILLQYRPVIRKLDIRKSGYKKGAGRVPAELLLLLLRIVLL
jgi:hypothetical protein